MVAVYNATAKISWAERSLPVLALRTVPSAVAAIRTLRPRFATQPISVPETFIRTPCFAGRFARAPRRMHKVSA